MSGLARLNALSDADARAGLLRCCGSTRWAERMAASRPFASEASLLGRADEVWRDLELADRMEAFAAHPRIGSKKDVASAPAGTKGWAAGEQKGADAASADTLAALAEGNRAYDERFGFVFLICATGKTADEMLAALRKRLPNERDAEIAIAAEEQRKITAIRLGKLMHEGG